MDNSEKALVGRMIISFQEALRPKAVIRPEMNATKEELKLFSMLLDMVKGRKKGNNGYSDNEIFKALVKLVSSSREKEDQEKKTPSCADLYIAAGILISINETESGYESCLSKVYKDISEVCQPSDKHILPARALDELNPHSRIVMVLYKCLKHGYKKVDIDTIPKGILAFSEMVDAWLKDIVATIENEDFLADSKPREAKIIEIPESYMYFYMVLCMLSPILRLEAGTGETENAAPAE